MTDTTAPRKPFRVGFTGTTLDEILPWADDQVGDAEKVVVAMAGSGKDIAWLARPGRSIRSYDPQEFSRTIVSGVFMDDRDDWRHPLPFVGTEHVAGYATSTLPWHIPEDIAGVVDYVATGGCDYDRAALGHALIRNTFMGRLSAWGRDSTAESLVRTYDNAWHRFEPYSPLPGQLRHTKGSCFDDPKLYTELDGAVLYIDTPKVLTKSKKGGDIYSRGFLALNSVLAQADQYLPPWTEESFRANMPDLFEGPWRRMVFFHATGCYPDVDQVEAMLRSVGLSVPEPTTWTHKGRTDVAWVIDR